jgi:tryptophanyl-tRNA synthetase
MVKRVLTGARTTGALHLGHYVGALKQWVDVQNSDRYECFFLLADVQALTTHADKPELLETSVKQVVLDWLSLGLDPSKKNVHFVLQSQVNKRSDLSVLLTMIARYSEVMRNPTLKDELKNQKNATIGFMTYPVDQVADIYMISPTPPQKDDELLVPVGEDQAPHLEYARVLAKRFNKQYGEVFVPCRTLTGAVGRLIGLDGGAKMSKSLDNAIYLSDSKEDVLKKVMRMYTDPKRLTADIPGDVVNNPVFIYHRAFNPDRQEVEELSSLYQKGRIGDVEVKKKLAKVLNNFLEPIREKRDLYEKKDLRDFLVEGTKVASNSCESIVEKVKEKMHLTYPKA